MSAPRIAAVDVGSSSIKGAIFGGDGVLVARAEIPVAVERDGERVTHAPEELAAGVATTLAALHARGGGADAVALAAQRSTSLLWERATGAPLTRARSWQDHAEAQRSNALAADAGEIARRTGLRLSPYYAAAKLAALFDELPRGRARAEAGEIVAGTLDAFLVQRLTGEASTEPGHAGRTLLYALDEDAWDPWLAERFAVPLAALPPILPSAGVRGVLRDGPFAGVPLVALLGDQQAALVGDGGAESGVVVAHFGTGAFVLADVGAVPRRREGLLAAVTWSSAVARRCQLEAAVNSAGSAVDWALRTTGADLAACGAAPLDAIRLPLFLPSFVGVGAPHWLPAAGAVLAGAALDDDGPTLVRGVLAGVVQRVADGVEALGAAGLPTRVVRASGRLATLPAVGALLADSTGLPVEVVAEEEAGLRGVARLARLALGGGDEPLGAPPRVGVRHLPQASAAERRRLRARWLDFLAAAAALPAPRR